MEIDEDDVKQTPSKERKEDKKVDRVPESPKASAPKKVRPICDYIVFDIRVPGGQVIKCAYYARSQSSRCRHHEKAMTPQCVGCKIIFDALPSWIIREYFNE